MAFGVATRSDRSHLAGFCSQLRKPSLVWWVPQLHLSRAPNLHRTISTLQWLTQSVTPQSITSQRLTQVLSRFRDFHVPYHPTAYHSDRHLNGSSSSQATKWYASCATNRPLYKHSNSKSCLRCEKVTFNPHPCSIYINEHLTKDRASLFHEARDLVIWQKKIQRAWTHNRVVFIRLSDLPDSRPLRVNSASDLPRGWWDMLARALVLWKFIYF